MQQLNLYQKKFHKRELGFDKAWFKLFLSVAVVGVLVSNAFFFQQQWVLKEKRQRVAEQHKQLLAKITILKKNIGDGKEDPQLSKRLEDLSNDLRLRRIMSRNLLIDEGLKSTGFSERLIAFAKAVPPGLWLESASINQQKNEIIIEGRLLEADLLPRFIEGLTKQEGLGRLGFRTVKVASGDYFQSNPEERAANKHIGSKKSSATDYAFYISTSRAPDVVPQDLETSLTEQLKEKAGEALVKQLPFTP